MAGKGQHVVPRDDGWAVRRSGSDKITRRFDSQSEAIRAAREIARNQGVALYIHDRSGLIRSRETFLHETGPLDE